MIAWRPRARPCSIPSGSRSPRSPKPWRRSTIRSRCAPSPPPAATTSAFFPSGLLLDEPYDAPAKARLAHLEPHLSTRLGTALRHAGAEIALGAQPSQADPGADRWRALRHRRGRPARSGRACSPRGARFPARAASTSSASRSIHQAPAPALPSPAAASTCRCGGWKTCRRASPNFISAWRGADAATRFAGCGRGSVVER